MNISPRRSSDVANSSSQASNALIPMNMKANLLALALSLPCAFAQSTSLRVTREVQTKTESAASVRSFSVYADGQVSLDSLTLALIGGKPAPKGGPKAKTMNFRWEDRDGYIAMFTKFGGWEKTAQENKVEPFAKLLAHPDPVGVAKEYYFNWNGAKAWLTPGDFTGEDCAALLALLQAELNGAKKELDERIAKQEKESALFK
jgi:hypothetical protein